MFIAVKVPDATPVNLPPTAPIAPAVNILPVISTFSGDTPRPEAIPAAPICTLSCAASVPASNTAALPPIFKALPIILFLTYSGPRVSTILSTAAFACFSARFLESLPPLSLISCLTVLSIILSLPNDFIKGIIAAAAPTLSNKPITTPAPIEIFCASLGVAPCSCASSYVDPLPIK